MKVAVENETIKVNSPYNKSFVAGQSRYRASGTPLAGSSQRRTRKLSRRYSSNAMVNAENLVRLALSQ